jgi:adenylate cyclase
MADLIAQGEEAQQRWRKVLPEGERVVVGRTAAGWAVPWDPQASRQHAELVWTAGRLDVVRLPAARNPIFFRGQEASQFSMRPGEHFVIGQTRFTLTDQRVSITSDVPQPVQQQSFSSQYLRQIRFRNPDHRIEVLSRLPEVVSQAADDSDLCVCLVNMLLAGVPRADTAAVVAVEGPLAPEDGSRPPVHVLHWDQRLVTGDDFHPSERLILQALRQHQGVLHVWQGTEPSEAQMYTARRNVDWAFCTPVSERRGQGWALYVAGRFHMEVRSTPDSADPNDLREDMKFAELVAGGASSMRQMRQLERQQASLSQFFSPVVLGTLAAEESPDEVLAPKETEVSVLFCDLRGFSLETERHADDLMGLLNRVSQALGVMTHEILDQGGVVGDFQGDAAMGFWGWPLRQPDAVVRTCQAALAIRSEFERAAREPDSPLTGFHVGIGVASGRAVAGKIGTVDQAKVTVFGPVVNLASRLEGMTKVLRAPILVDQATANAVRQEVPLTVARVRKLAVVRPYGMDTQLEVSELLPPKSDYPLLTDEHLECCDAAVDAFVAGRWSEAFTLLLRTPTEDLVTDFLTGYIVQHNRTPPPGWDGVISLLSK